MKKFRNYLKKRNIGFVQKAVSNNKKCAYGADRIRKSVFIALVCLKKLLQQAFNYSILYTTKQTLQGPR